MGTETHPVEGVMKEEKSWHSRKPSHREFLNLRVQDNGGGGGGDNRMHA